MRVVPLGAGRQRLRLLLAHVGYLWLASGRGSGVKRHA